MPERQTGFSLLELVIVLVIAGLIMALVGTSISRSVSSAEMRATVRDLATSMRYTRTKAIIDKEEMIFTVDTENMTYEAPGRGVVELPEGMTIGLITARSELTSETVGNIRWYPDGGSTGGYIELEGNDRVWRVDVAWLTGEARLRKEDR